MPTILTVDDSQAIRQLVRATLNSSGYDVHEAASGASAIEQVKNQAFDLILSDVNMPIMNGFELVASLRAAPLLYAAPILMLTTEFSGEQKARAKIAGANGWVMKPIDPDQLLRAVSRVLGTP